MKRQEVIILGNDHTNTLGLVQCLGSVGFQMVAFVWGLKSGIVGSSRYADEVYSAKSPQDCVDLIIEIFGEETHIIPIIACSDDAALVLEKNKERLRPHFLFEYSSKFPLANLFVKELQVELAIKSGFNVPISQLVDDFTEVKNGIGYPCIIKPLVSCQGAKSDIRVCHSEKELINNIHSLEYTKKVLLQQYIERDYEISILGCGLSNGDVIIPCVENKLTLYPKYVGLECLSNMQPLDDSEIITPIKNLVRSIGYVGLFSVEMMHCRNDNNFYFTEINLRNDGANSFVFKYGVNLPLNHVEDLLGFPISKFEGFKPGYYIWEMHHSLSLAHREIAFSQWIKEIKMSEGFLTYFKSDKKPFFKQYSNWILTSLKLRKNESY